MCLEESFGPFTIDALNVGQPCPSAIITAPRDAVVNILLYHSALLPLMLTGKAESAQITHQQEMYSICNVSILVSVCRNAAVLWHAVVQL